MRIGIMIHSHVLLDPDCCESRTSGGGMVDVDVEVDVRRVRVVVETVVLTVVDVDVLVVVFVVVLVAVLVRCVVVDAGDDVVRIGESAYTAMESLLAYTRHLPNCFRPPETFRSM